MNIRDNLGYLLVNLCKVHKRHGERAFRELGLYAGQDLVLAELWERETMNQADLVERLWVQPPTVTKILNRLENAGLIERRTDPEDARRSLVTLTDQGRDLQEPVEEAWRRLDEAMTAGLRQEERLLLRRMLQQMQENLEAE